MAPLTGSNLQHIEWKSDAKLTSFIQALSVALPQDKVFLPTMVGFRSKEKELEDSTGLVPIVRINDVKQVRKIATQVRRSTVPQEAGGGHRSEPRVILGDKRFTATREHGRGFMRGDYRRFPEPTNHHCVTLLISHRQKQLLQAEKKAEKHAREEVKRRRERDTKTKIAMESPMDLLASAADVASPLPPDSSPWALPPKAERKAGWALGLYSKRVRPVALKELKMTRNRAMVAFDALSPDEMALVTKKTAQHNFKLYAKLMETFRRAVARKRKREEEDADNKELPAKRQKTDGGKEEKKVDDDENTDSDSELPATFGLANRSVEEKRFKQQKREHAKPKEQELPPGPSLELQDFVTLAGPKTPSWLQVAARVPKKLYLLSVTTFFWLLDIDAHGMSKHDYLIGLLEE